VIRVHLLSDELGSQNTLAFLAPIFCNWERIRQRGIELRLFYRADPDFGDCDVVGINSKFWAGPWKNNRNTALVLLERLRRAGVRIVYFDRSSTPGSLLAELLPLVDQYYKTAVYADRSNYLRSVYCNRLFSEFYHRANGVDDGMTVSIALPSEQDLAKLGVAWNTGLANYSMFGPRLGSLYRYFPWRGWFSPPRHFPSPSARRQVPLSCRMNTTYKYASVAYQRLEAARLLSQYRRTNRISKPSYFRELRNSRIIVSPFGYSEINYKDFETFLNGAVLLKPDMSHLETWPNYFRPNETYVPIRWSLFDLQQRAEEILSSYGSFIEIARQGQSLYRWHIADEDGQEAFAERFADMVGSA